MSRALVASAALLACLSGCAGEEMRLSQEVVVDAPDLSHEADLVCEDAPSFAEAPRMFAVRMVRAEPHGGVLQPRWARVAGIQPPRQQALVLLGLDPVLLIEGGELAAAGHARIAV